ncbi:MAG: CCA tRNA nucleotidyltransferase [Pseudomonadota bacterium]
MANPEVRTLEADAAGFLSASSLVAVFDALEAARGEVRVNGGAVRNALMGEPVSDVDLSTDLVPSAVIEAAKAAGLKSVPTGMDHGTITIVSGGDAYEVTTLREDIETDGRHAVVKFGTNWQADAHRRDFTVNAIYASRDGTLTDYVGGLEDIRTRTIRFIGNAGDRIAEDHLRILRLFRFFAWYGPERVGRPDADALRASARMKDELASLSVERVWKELRKMLAAPDPSKSLLWMRTTGVLNIVLPESEKWGIDAIHGLVEAEREHGWSPDALLRLAAIVPLRVDDLVALAKRLRLSNADRDGLVEMASVPTPNGDLPTDEWREMMYRNGKTALARRLKLAIAVTAARGEDAPAAKLLAQLEEVESFSKPQFPLSGADLIAMGAEQGPSLGKHLARLETTWLASGFQTSRDELLAQFSSAADD